MHSAVCGYKLSYLFDTVSNSWTFLSLLGVLYEELVFSPSRTCLVSQDL